MKRLGRWLTALCLLGLVVAWAVPSGAEVPPGYEPEVKLLNPQEYQDDSGNHSGKSALVSGEVSAKQPKSGGFWGWLGDHGMGVVKGIGAGLIGAAIVVGAAVLIGVAGAPLLVMAGAAVVGGAMYGAFTGSSRFNWTDAILGSVISGISAGVGSWIAGSASPVIARAGVALTNMVGGGLASLSSYLVHESHPTWGGAATAFGIGAGTAALFMAGGAVVSKGWRWAEGALGLGKGAGGGGQRSGVVAAALSEPASLDGTGTGPILSASSPADELRDRVRQNIDASRRAREASRFGEYAITEAQVGDIVKWRATHGYQYDVYTEGPLGGRLSDDPARNFFGMKYNQVVLSQDSVFFRGGVKGVPFGKWFSTTPPASEALVRIDSAVKKIWLKPGTLEYSGTSLVDTVYAIKIPKGSTVYVGPVSNQGGPYLGGETKIQVFIPAPWSLDGVQILGSWGTAK